MKKIHYNYALHPAEYRLPACMVGSEKNFEHLVVTLDKKKITCKRCRKALGLKGGAE